MSKFFNRFKKGLGTLVLIGTMAFSNSCTLPHTSYIVRSKSNSVEQIINGEGEKYAVLISGKTEERHVHNLELAYSTLLSLGFEKENIYIFDDKNNNSNNYSIYNITTKSNIRSTLKNLSDKINENDLFLLYTTSHGGRAIYKYPSFNGIDFYEGVSTLTMASGEPLSSIELNDYLKNIQSNFSVYIFDQCRAGDFVNNVGESRFVGLAPNIHSRKTSGNTWPHAFWNAFINNKGDSNNDKRVSMLEAFRYANRNDSNTFVYSTSFFKNGYPHTPIMRTDLNIENLFLD
jgi:hypothetical protein